MQCQYLKISSGAELFPRENKSLQKLNQFSVKVSTWVPSSAESIMCEFLTAKKAFIAVVFLVICSCIVSSSEVNQKVEASQELRGTVLAPSEFDGMDWISANVKSI